MSFFVYKKNLDNIRQTTKKNYFALFTTKKSLFKFFSDGKYHMLPTGELLIINITRMDAQRTYRCRTYHALTQEAVVSGNVGRIQIAEMREPVPPIMNEKNIQITVKLDEPVIIPCVAYANPRPQFR